MRLRSWLVVAIAVLAVVLLAGRAVTALVVEHAWFVAMGVPGIFWEQLTDTALLQGIAWVVGSLFAFANLHAVRLTILAVAVPSRVANIELTAMIPTRRLLSITIIAAGMIGLALALPLTDWTSVAMARHGVPFGEIDGILEHDLGFYVYMLPLEETAYLWSLASLVLMVLMTTLLYALTRSLRMEGRRIIASSHVRRHLSVLGALVLLLLAWSYRLDTFDLLQQGSGPDGMFLRIDHVISLQADRVLVAMCAIAAPIFLRSAWQGQLRSAFVTLSLVLFSALAGRQLLPIALSRSALIGDPGRRDENYVTTRTLTSRRAYDVDQIRTASPEFAVTPQNALRTRVSLSDLSARLSLWIPEAARLRGTDGRSGMLDASSAGWTRTDDGHVAALLVRRPVAGNDRWTIVLTDATAPLLRDSVLDVNPGARGDDRDPLGEPIAAPGLHEHRIVTDAAGVPGTPLSGVGMRVAQAWAARDPALLDAEPEDGPSTRLVAHRDVRDRIARLVPVLVQGGDIQPILHDDVLLWAVSLYSASDHFPLSYRWTIAGAERSYFKFAATALIDATTGRVRIVPVERPDPIARSWLDRIPTLVVQLRDLPDGLADLLPPATDGTIAQVKAFARFGSRLEGSVERHLPDSALVGTTPPIHLVTSDRATAAAWSVPLLDGNERIDGVITAVGGRHRATYWDSTTVPRARWGGESERLRAALDSARATIPEGTRREPRMRTGRVIAVPGEDGPILVQSLIWNRADGAPIVTRVGVLEGQRLAVGPTIAEAVASLRGVSSGLRRDLTPVAGAAGREERIMRLYEVMRDAMRRGDWTRFGAAFDSLGAVLGRTPR